MLLSRPHERAWTQGPTYPKRMVGSRERQTTVTEGTPKHSWCTGQDVFCLTQMMCSFGEDSWAVFLSSVSSTPGLELQSHQQCLLCWRQQILPRELPTFTTPL